MSFQTPDPNDTDTSWMDYELAVAESTLRNLYHSQRKEKSQMNPAENDPNTVASTTSLANKINQLQDLQIQMDYLTAAHEFCSWEETLATNGFYTLPNGRSIVDPIALHKLQVIMLSLHQFQPLSSSSQVHESDLRAKLQNRYKYLYVSSRYAVQLHIRSILRSQGYPKEDASVHDLKSQLMSFLKQHKKQSTNPNEFFLGMHIGDFASCSAYLMYLDVIHQPIEDIGTLNNDHIQSNMTEKKKIQVHMLDELCRPIIERVLFHFQPTPLLSNKNHMDYDDTDPNEAGNEAGNEADNDRRIENKVVVEHLLTYIRTIMENPLVLIAKVFLPLSNYIQAAIQCSTALQDSITSPSTFSPASPPHLVNYFLNEMVHLAFYLMKQRRVFQDKALLKRPSLFLHALDQILQFDEYIYNCTREYSVDNHHPPRLINLLLSSSPALLQKWFSMEWKGATYLLSGSPQPESTNTTDNGNPSLTDLMDDDEAKTTPQTNPAPHLLFISNDAEVFISLFHSFHLKYKLITHEAARESIMKDVLIPLSVQYLEQLHGHAKYLMNQLDEWGKNKKKKTKNEMKHKDKEGDSLHLTVEQKLKQIISDWCDILTGSNQVILLLMNLDNNSTSHNYESNPLNNNSIAESKHADDLNRVGQSLQRLQEAMIDECSSFLVEHLMMEKAKMAMYLMQCPHLLSLSLLETTMKQQSLGTSEDEFISTLSLDIINAWNILSVITESCHEKLNYIQNAVNLSSTNVNATSSWRENDVCYLSFGADTLLSCLANKISDKFTEIVLDQLQVFEIRLGGACQFRHDVEAVIGLFQNDGIQFKCFERLLNLGKLITMEWSRFKSLKNAMLGLCNDRLFNSSSFDESSVLDREENTLSVEILESDMTVTQEAKSMLAAKGLESLKLSDAVLVMNHRME